MPIDALARQDDARKALELTRARLERAARRFADRQTLAALRELQRAALAFDAAQQATDETVRAWARALAPADRFAAVH